VGSAGSAGAGNCDVGVDADCEDARVLAIARLWLTGDWPELFPGKGKLSLDAGLAVTDDDWQAGVDLLGGGLPSSSSSPSPASSRSPPLPASSESGWKRFWDRLLPLSDDVGRGGVGVGVDGEDGEGGSLASRGFSHVFLLGQVTATQEEDWEKLEVDAGCGCWRLFC